MFSLCASAVFLRALFERSDNGFIDITNKQVGHEDLQELSAANNSDY